ncbi:uncharacterized protein LOC111037916 [Myzus persicae]|uniref:uncharacterized protein LOC111037916 n=1 Tax=Myzus persicae TaxID=13164 RepID=UPI000B9322CF|nr:uncharacterized protein LOC111037916 [Myzus persicae]
MNDDNFNYDMDHQFIEEAEVTEDFKEADGAVKSITLESHEENEMEINGDKRVWVKASDELLSDQIKEEIQDCEYQTIVDVKDEIEEVEEEEIKTPTIYEAIPPPPPAIDIQAKKVAVSKVNFKPAKKPRGRMGRRPRPILPMTRPIASVSTPHLEQASTQHQLIMPSTQMPGIAYQIFLGDHGKNSNNPVQYTMLQPRPVFLQQSPSSVSNTSPVVISQSYPMTRSQVPCPKVPKIAPKIVSQTYCSFCYKLFKNMNEHVKECWANPASKSYKFRKIAPSTSC